MSTNESPLKPKKVLSGKNDLEQDNNELDSIQENKLEKCDPGSSTISHKYVRSEVLKVKTKNEKPF